MRPVQIRGWRPKEVREGQRDIRLGGNADDALKRLGVSGQGERLKGLPCIAAGQKEIDSDARPPFVEGPQQGAAHFAKGDAGKAAGTAPSPQPKPPCSTTEAR